MKLRITSATIRRRTNYVIDKIDDSGKVIAAFTSCFDKLPKNYAECARIMGVSAAFILDFVENKHKVQQLAEVEIAPPRPASKFSVRPEVGSGKQEFNTFPDALSYALPQHGCVIEWQDNLTTCCLDIDFHGQEPPPEGELLAFCNLIRPAPAVFWVSRSGGAHLIYNADARYTAEEFAVAAAYEFLGRFPTCSFELLHRTRQPAGAAYSRTEDYDINPLRKLLGEVSEVDSTEWLEERGLVPGARYKHESCPVNPGPGGSGSDCVIVYADHIHCFNCATDGITRGSKTPGHFPIAYLIHGRNDSNVGKCVNNFVHFGHAKHVLAKHIPAKLMEKVYRALLKLKHGDDERINMVFTAGEPLGMFRAANGWVDRNGLTVRTSEQSAILRTFPCCYSPDTTGELTLNPAAVATISTPSSLSNIGYVPCTVIRGIQFSQFQEIPPDRVLVAIPSTDLAPDCYSHVRPRYIPSSKRMDIEEAWKIVTAPFPGIDRKLLELLLVGRGCYEHRCGLPPMLFICGSAGSGKTTHVQVAAAIAGDAVADMPLPKNAERIHQALRDSKQGAGFVHVDEVFKKGKTSGASAVEAMETLLSFVPNAMGHQLYTGHVAMGALPMLVWSDIHIPSEVQANAQIGRRMHFHQLEGSVSWETTMREHGLNYPSDLRTLGGVVMVDACNSVLSHIIDTHFSEPATNFAQVAANLGFKKLSESDAVKDKSRAIEELFAAINAVPPLAEDVAKRRTWCQSPNARPFSCDSQDAIYNALLSLWHPDEIGTKECRAVDEVDLQKLLKLEYPARLEIKQHGQKFAIGIKLKKGGSWKWM